MSFTSNLISQMASGSGGVDAFAGQPADIEFLFSGTWQLKDQWTATLTDQGLQTQIGAGNVTGVTPTFAFTWANKVYLLAGDALYFCGLGDAYQWNQPTVTLDSAPGNGFIELANSFGISENLAAVAIYQGKLAITSRNAVQIWAMDPDPTLNAQQQVLANVGTVAKETVRSLGDLDVYMLSDTGIRSIRARDASNAAIVNDIGSPIDLLLQPLLAAMSDATKATACGIIEPLTHRYFCYVPGDSIYVLSYFPNSQIQAWSTYVPTYQNVLTPVAGVVTLVNGQSYQWVQGTANSTLTVNGVVITKSQTFTAAATSGTISGSGEVSQRIAFTPQRFVVYQGRVYVRDTANNVYLYGGTNNATYDACGMQARTPYLDLDAPATQKDFQGVDAAFEGDWSIAVGTDYAADTFTKLAYRNNVSSFQLAKIPVNRRGTHVAFDCNEYSNGYARLSSAIIHFKQNQPKV